MKRSLFRLVVFAAAAFVLLGPGEAEAQMTCDEPSICCAAWCSGIFFPLGWATMEQLCCTPTGCFFIRNPLPIGQCCWGGPYC